MEAALEAFSALSDRTRLRIYRLLLGTSKKICVCELIDALEQSQYNVSKHLQILKKAGLAKENRMGRWIMYSAAVNSAVDTAAAVMRIKDVQFEADAGRLEKRLRLRAGGEVVSCGIKTKKMEAKNEDRGIGYGMPEVPENGGGCKKGGKRVRLGRRSCQG